LAIALREDLGAPLTAALRPEHERVMQEFERLLGADALAALLDEGRSTNVERVVRMIEAVPALAGASPDLLPERLTARETEVLRLLTRGLTDQQIAQTLVISPRTVHTHLVAIYGKLRVKNRSAATRWALEHSIA